jgi:hypothetical protein
MVVEWSIGVMEWGSNGNGACIRVGVHLGGGLQLREDGASLKREEPPGRWSPSDYAQLI